MNYKKSARVRRSFIIILEIISVWNWCFNWPILQVFVLCAVFFMFFYQQQQTRNKAKWFPLDLDNTKSFFFDNNYVNMMCVFHNVCVVQFYWAKCKKENEEKTNKKTKKQQQELYTHKFNWKSFLIRYYCKCK